MSKFPKILTGLARTTALAAALASPAYAERMGLGRAAMPEEIHAWDRDVRPDGLGLPDGSGDVATGEEVFSEHCAACHGEFAEGVDNWPKLAGGKDTLNRADPVKTVGSYWPYLSTTFDYVRRSMPYGNAQTLADDDVYAIVAYILYSNDLVDDDFVLSKDTFTGVELPNVDGFFVDNRDEVELPVYSAPACMENCKDSVEITKHATNLDVTPNDANDDAAPVEEAPADAPTAEPTAEPAADTAPAAMEASKTAEADPEPEPADPALIEAGAKVFKKCAACHKVGEGAKNAVGPQLNAVVGRTAGGLDGFKYSPAMSEAGANGMVWDAAALDAYLLDPKGTIPKNKMSYAGLKKPEDRAAIIAYLGSLSN